VPTDSTAEVRAESLPAFARTLPARLGRGLIADDPSLVGRYRIELGGPAPLAWTVRLADGRADSPADETADPDVTVASDPSAFALVMTNRRPASTFEAAGRWRTSGDPARAAAFARAFRSY
jgi:hypothetical protein